MAASPTRARIAGLDIARGFAILGMFAAHMIPRADEAELFVDGRSSILFATLAGVSLGILTGSDRLPGRGERLELARSIVLRATILVLLGLILTSFDSGVAVILDYYGFMFLLMTPLLFLPRRMLAPVAVLLLVAAPLVAAAQPERSPTTEPLAYFLQSYFLTGFYPVLVWLPFLIVGLIAVRSGLDRERTQQLMVFGGLAAVIAGYGGAAVFPGVSAEAHSGSSAELLGSGGLAIAVIGALLWLTAAERAAPGRVLRGLLWPIGAAGSMALTLYTLQIIALIALLGVRDTSGELVYPGWPLLVGLTLASLAFASVWKLLLGKGPLERLLTVVTRPRPLRRSPSRV